MSDPIIGRQLGDYVIQELLGRGGMARVYRGYDARLQRFAAVKVIASDFSTADQAEYTERFRKEARSIARLHHPNIVGVYQFGEQNDLYYMAMVFIEGQDLRQIIREVTSRAQVIPTDQALNIVKGISAALDYAHTRGVIHRDVKPSNIMLDAENHPVLTDFGLALNTSDGTLGDTFGSAHYIAPEQAISSARAVPQSDLYSLGVCIYEMLTGYVPFDDPSAMTVAMKHLNEVPPSPRQFNPNITAAVERVILRSLEKDPSRRYESGAEFAQAFESALTWHPDDDLQKLLNASQESKSDVFKSGLKQLRTPTKPNLTPIKPPPTEPPTTVVGIEHEETSETDMASHLRSGRTGVKTSTSEMPTYSGPIPTASGTFSQPDKNRATAGSPPTSENKVVNFTAPGSRIFDPNEKHAEPAAEAVPATGNRRLPLIIGAVAIAVIVIVGIVALLSSGGTGGSGTPTAQNTSAAGGVTASPAQPVVIASEQTETGIPTTGLAMASTSTPEPTEEASVSDVPSATSMPDTDTPTPTRTSTFTATPSPSPVPPTAVPNDGADIELVYDGDQLNALNISGHTLDISQLALVQHGADDRRFNVIDWDSEFAANPVSSWPITRCYQVARFGASGNLSPLAGCSRARLAAFRYVNRDAQVWVAQDDQTTSFDVLWAETTIATCQISAGSCRFALRKD
ncbi:MAG: serine/threonine protein kinase [Anaerolineae bacterium]|nr:serine/threonine protein kinase [Anaerolineae bacterium]